MADVGTTTELPVRTAVLEAAGIEMSYRRGLRHRQNVLRGADITLPPGEVVGLVGERTAPASRR